ncbi:hypothetical protein BH23ACT6_BH23ACT6_08200 [soil metagenome]
MRTWHVDKPKQRQFAIAALAIQVLMLAVMIALIIWRDAGSWILTLVIVASLMPTFVAWQQTQMSTTANDNGLVIYDGFRSRQIPWSQVSAIGRHETHDLVAMRHTDGQDVVLPGVHGEDVAQLRSLLGEHR